MQSSLLRFQRLFLLCKFTSFFQLEDVLPKRNAITIKGNHVSKKRSCSFSLLSSSFKTDHQLWHAIENTDVCNNLFHSTSSPSLDLDIDATWRSSLESFSLQFRRICWRFWKTIYKAYQSANVFQLKMIYDFKLQAVRCDTMWCM